MGVMNTLAEIVTALGSFGPGGYAYSNTFKGNVSEQLINSRNLKQAANTYNSINAGSSLMGTVKTLAEKAKEGILMYPMLISTNIQEQGLVYTICKYQELQYAMFTMVVAGFNPIAMKGVNKVGDYINMTLSSESIDPEKMKDADIEGLSYKIEPASKEDIDRAKELVTDSMAAYDFGEDDRMSLEATPSSQANLGTLATKVIMNTGQYQSQSMNFKNKIGVDNSGNPVYAKPFDLNVTSKNSLDQIQLKKGPTIVNLTIMFGQNKVVVPIIVKVVPHLLDPEELKSLFEVSLQDKNWTNRWIKWTTGEISFFRDLIFQVDLAEKNAELYKKMGRHPWIKNLEHRKMLSLLNNQFTSKRDHMEIAPTATIITTKEEMSDATKLSYPFILKHPEFIYKIVDKLFLMALMIYDVDMETFSIYYAGYSKPIMYSLSEMKMSDADQTTALTKIISTLSTKM